MPNDWYVVCVDCGGEIIHSVSHPCPAFEDTRVDEGGDVEFIVVLSFEAEAS
jgi:hypothetical protein